MSGAFKFIVRAAGLGLILLVACSPQGPQSDFERARKALDAGQDVSAKALLEQAIRAHPGSPEIVRAYNELGVASWRLGEIDNATIAFESSRNLDASYAPAAYNLGVLMHQGSNDVRAVALFKEAAELDPEDTKALAFVAAMDMESGQWASAREALRQALARDPRSPETRTALAVALLHTSGAEAAVAQLETVLDDHPRYAPAHFNLGRIHDAWLHDPVAARHHLEAFLELTDDDDRAADAVSLLGDLSPDGGSDPVGDAARGTPLPEARSIEPEPQVIPPRRVIPPPPRPSTIEGLLDLALRYSREGREFEALQMCRDAAEIARQADDPDAEEQVLRSAAVICRDQAGAHYDLGLYLLNAERASEALRVFRQSVALSPQWIPGYLGMADAAARTGIYDTAEIALERVLRLDASNREALWGMARLHDRDGQDPSRAIRAYRDFLAVYQTDPRASTARERIREIQERALTGDTPTPSAADPEPEEPPSEVRTVPTDVEPRSLPIRAPGTRNRTAAVGVFNEGAAQQSRQEWDLAIASYMRALEYDDTFVQAYYNLGVVCQRAERLGLSETAYLRALALEPCHVSARFNLALLYRDRSLPSKTIEQLQAILTCDETHARSHYFLGLILADDARTELEAVPHFESFLRLAPDDPAAASVRRWLANRR